MEIKGSKHPRPLPKEVAGAALGFGRAVFRRLLKKTSHRKPKDSEVERKFQAFLADGQFFDSTRRLICKMEDRVKASGKKLDKTGRAFAQQLVIDRLDAYSRLIDPPPGRPKSPVPQISLINGVLNKSSAVHDTERDRANMADLKKSLIARNAGTKLRQFMRREGKEHLDLEEAKQYVRQAGAEVDVLSMRSNAKAVRDFIEAKELNPGRTVALEKELSRNKLEVAEVLTEALEK